MNRQDLIDIIAARTTCTKVAASSFLDGFVVAVTEALLRGEKVKLAGFGTFESISGRPRKGRNLRTGQEVSIGPATRPRFTASLTFRARFVGNVVPPKP